MKLQTPKNSFLHGKTIVWLFFAVAVVVEVLANLLSFEAIIFAFKPLVVLLTMYLYWINSNERSWLFLCTLFFLLLTSILILFDSELFLNIGLFCILIHMSLILLCVIRLNKIKDFVPVIIATVPFIFVFSYLLTISDEIMKDSFFSLVAQNILVSIFAGLVLSNYFMNLDNYTPWLSIFGLVSIALYFIVFIEKCFLSDFPPTYLRPLGMVLFATSYYTFYKFVIDAERLNDFQKATS